jgi:hypothetical protein
MLLRYFNVPLHDMEILSTFVGKKSWTRPPYPLVGLFHTDMCDSTYSDHKLEINGLEALASATG